MKVIPQKATKQNLALPGKALTPSELKESVKVAEKGPFLTTAEARKMAKKWRDQLGSK